MLERKRCETCDKPLGRFSNWNCSMACRDWASRLRRSRARLDRLMAMYEASAVFYMRDMWLTMADEEAGTLKFLTHWDKV